jgi:hypothetical protein
MSKEKIKDGTVKFENGELLKYNAVKGIWVKHDPNEIKKVIENDF